MNEQIKELALQAEAQYCDLSDASIFKRLGLTEAVVFKLTDLEAFAELIAAQEREACIKLVHEGTGYPVQTKTLFILQKERKRIAEAIRAREPLRGCNPSKVLVDEIHARGNT